jgi:hypothetical protein
LKCVKTFVQSRRGGSREEVETYQTSVVAEVPPELNEIYKDGVFI